MIDDEYEPADQALGGLRLVPLPEGVVALEAAVLIKAIDADGRPGWYSRWTEGLSHIEVVGACRVMGRLAEDNAMAAYVDDPSDDD